MKAFFSDFLHFLILFGGMYIYSNILLLLTCLILLFLKFKYFTKYDFLLLFAPYMTTVSLLMAIGTNKSFANLLVEPFIVSLLSILLILTRPITTRFVSTKWVSIISLILLCLLSMIVYKITPFIGE